MPIFGKGYDYFLGYALSGGGAKGFAHLGTLKVLEQYGLKPDVIAGTSAGALAGVFYADGFHPDEIVDLFRKHEFREFVSFTIPRTGFLKSTGLHTFLKKNLRARSFEELQLPFYAIATDWEKARTVAFSKGDNLVDAVVASCSVPIVFSPQLIDGIPYVDGGILKNFPVTVIRKMCRYVVGVNVSLIIPKSEKESIRTMVERTFNLMSNSNTLMDKVKCDILIETSGLEKISMFDLHSQNQIIEVGYHAAANTMAEKKSLEIVRRCHRHALLEQNVKNRLEKMSFRKAIK